MGREFELKFRADAASLAAIQQKYGPFTTLQMRTAYYDNPAGTLSERHWTLRRRMENGEPVCTVKTPGDNGSRGEWETVCSSVEEAIPALIAMGAPAELAQLTAEGVAETCGVRFTRLAAPVSWGNSVLELALDQGVFIGGSAEEPFAEAEVELKQGADEDAVTFGRLLAQEFGLVPESQSKLKRARDLANRNK